ncbi:MAG TPA: diguanylate cyclase [Thermoanaerobaculia bacterium]|nr:diguanylate cyclase [Thermoanaerobaculia bacterium]
MSVVAQVVSSPATRLLIVDDDARYARALRELLTESFSDLHITHVTTIDEACRRVDTGQVDMVILDLGLPDADGLESLERLHDCILEIPIIVLTARSDENLALAALQHGAEDYLVKDAVNHQILARSLRYALERHRVIRDLGRVTKELQVANSNLEKLTLLDPLTELLNRRGLQQALSREIERIDRENIDVLVLLVDIDDFKRVNDSFGHAVGDIALQEIAKRLRHCVRAVDYACRIGGDEFLMLLPNADRDEASSIAERARVSIATMIIQHSTGTLHLTSSVAAMLLRRDTPSIDELLTQAHQLLRRSKSEGKNRVVYEDEIFEDTEKRNDAQADLCTNLAQGKYLRTVKQPIFRIADEVPVAYEFLSRYSNGVFEMPDNFFRVCAERNVLTLVDHHCLRSALRTATAIPERKRFHVNLFPSTLIAIPTEHLLSSFPHPIPPQTYCVEISEQQIIGDPSYLREPVQMMRNAGLMIAIDDVGFGNSCLESLILLEPDIIKIDKRCIIGLSGDRMRTESLRRYVDLAETLHSQLVAEGVETPRELSVLRDLHVEYAQGFLWGRPA